MPITLGCPSCSKKFRARDESAGKRVKCPYCSAPVPVPAGDEEEQQQQQFAPPPSPGRSPLHDDDHPAPQQQQQQFGRSPLDDDEPGIGQVPTSRPNPMAPAPVSPPADWGADPIDQQRPKPFPPAASPPPPPTFPPATPPAFPPKTMSSPGFDMFPKPGATAPRPGLESPPRLGAGRPLGAGLAGASPGLGGAGAKDVDPAAIPGWSRARGGLFFVLFALLLLVVPGAVGFAKVMCVKNGVEMPKGSSADWVKISGYLNTGEATSIDLTKMEMIELLAYGLPVIFGGFILAFGRLLCGSAPHSSGVKGMFFLSGLFTFLAVIGLMAAFVTFKLFPEYYAIARPAFLISVVAAEFWFLAGLAGGGVSLKRPQTARAVGFLMFVAALLAGAATIGWTFYVRQRPTPVPDTTKLYEEAAVMVGWLLFIAMYWRTVRSMRRGISEFLETAGL